MTCCARLAGIASDDRRERWGHVELPSPIGLAVGTELH
jgi:hypothetical protein